MAEGKVHARPLACPELQGGPVRQGWWGPSEVPGASKSGREDNIHQVEPVFIGKLLAIKTLARVQNMHLKQVGGGAGPKGVL